MHIDMKMCIKLRVFNFMPFSLFDIFVPLYDELANQFQEDVE